MTHLTAMDMPSSIVFFFTEFDRLLQKHATETGLPVVVDFYSDSCGPCRMMAPIFKKVAKQFKEKAVFVKIDTNAQPELSSRYQIRSLPTFNFFVAGAKADQAVGGIGEQGLIQNTQKIVRQAEIENVLLTTEALTAYYGEVEPSKGQAEIDSVYKKCVDMTKKFNPQRLCVGAAANQLARRLRQKYKKAPKMETRYDPEATESSQSEPSSSPKEETREKPQRASRGGGGSAGKPNLNLATKEDLMAELERRLDEERDRQVEEEDADEDEMDPDYQKWTPGPFPERVVIVGGGPAGYVGGESAGRLGF